MRQVGMHEAKTKLSQLVERAEAGEDVVIARNGTPVVRLVAVGPTTSLAAVLFGRRAERSLLDETNQVLLSAAVIWEVAIKRSLGKLTAPEDLAPTLLGGGVQPLPISLDHAAAVERLPLHHRDPFDRMLVAQAVAEGAAIVSRDEALRPYGVELVW